MKRKIFLALGWFIGMSIFGIAANMLVDSMVESDARFCASKWKESGILWKYKRGVGCFLQMPNGAWIREDFYKFEAPK